VTTNTKPLFARGFWINTNQFIPSASEVTPEEAATIRLRSAVLIRNAERSAARSAGYGNTKPNYIPSQNLTNALNSIRAAHPIVVKSGGGGFSNGVPETPPKQDAGK
jgi:hypothetical protein